MPEIKKYVPLNWELVLNPVNWAIVILMIAIAGFAVAYIFPSKPKAETE